MEPPNPHPSIPLLPRPAWGMAWGMGCNQAGRVVGGAEGLTLALASHVNSYVLFEEHKYLPFLLLLRNTYGWKTSQLALCLQSPVVALC